VNTERLRQIVRTAIIEGQLPRSGGKPRIFGGQGECKACACCQAVIKPTEMQYDVDCTLEDKVHTLSMHMKCFQVWESESRALAGVAGHSVCEDAA
jgi:hypothetical protein